MELNIEKWKRKYDSVWEGMDIFADLISQTKQISRANKES